MTVELSNGTRLISEPMTNGGIRWIVLPDDRELTSREFAEFATKVHKLRNPRTA